MYFFFFQTQTQDPQPILCQQTSGKLWSIWLSWDSFSFWTLHGTLICKTWRPEKKMNFIWKPFGICSPKNSFIKVIWNILRIDLLIQWGWGGSCLCRWKNSCLATLNSACWVGTNSCLIEINLQIKSVETWIIRQLPTDKSRHPRIREVQSRVNIRLGLTYLLFTLSPYRLPICSIALLTTSILCRLAAYVIDLPSFQLWCKCKDWQHFIQFWSSNYRSVCLYSPKSLIGLYYAQIYL